MTVCPGSETGLSALNTGAARQGRTMIETDLTRRFDLRTPIVQAGMAFAGMTPDLAIAVSNAGAMGSIAIGMMPPEAMMMLIGGVRAGTDKPFHVNFITIYTSDAHIDALCAAPVAAVSFHWGHPKSDWIRRLQDAGIAVMEQVGSVEDARRAAGDGIDVVIAQGSEAGGHNYGRLPTFVLVPAVADAVGDTLVLASGGIMDGRGVAAALCLGAAGVWVGTRFVMSAESSAHPSYKERLAESDGTDTTLSHLFGRHHPQFNPMRVLKNGVVAEFEGKEDEVPADNGAERLIGTMQILGQDMELRRFGNLVPMIGTDGDFEELPLLSGQGVGLAGEVLPAATIVNQLTAEAEELLRCNTWTID